FFFYHYPPTSWLSTLSLHDALPICVAGRERLLEQVIGNLSVLVAHRQVVPASAELVARISGVRGVWKATRRADGTFTRARARERSEEHTSELQSRGHLVCRLLLEKK